MELHERTELENKMVQELQHIVDQLHEARKNGDTYAENYWQEYLWHARVFVKALTRKYVIIEKWKVSLKEVEL